MPNTPISRRLFSVGLAATPGLLARQSPPSLASPSESAVQDPPPPGARPRLEEKLPFAEPLTFVPKLAPLLASPFPLSQVRLLPGPCLDAAEANRGYMLRLTPDRLLHTFHLTAGLPSSAREYGGWEAPKSELRGHFTGHYLSACALRAASAGDQELKARGDEIVAGLARCQRKLDANGYLSAFPLELFQRLQQRKRVWAPFYTLHKIMAGLLDMHSLTGNKQALEVVSGMAAWADQWTAAQPESHMQQILKEEYGGMNEVLYNLSVAANEPRWAAVGDRFNKHAFFTPLAQQRDELRNLHANTHIPQVIGAARRFEISSDPRFRHVAEFFHSTLTSRRTYSPGGCSNAEIWLTHPGPLSLEWRAASRHQECCCAYNMLKLTRQLFSWTADPRYFDYYERNLFNHRLGAIQLSTGHSIYFLSLSPGAWKTLNTEDSSFWCCNGSALEEYSKLSDSIYYHDGDGILVNLFVASTLDARHRSVQLRQDTRFPDEPLTTITITRTPAVPWTLKLRIPAWTTSASLKINGRSLAASPGPSSYLAIHRVWKNGDRLELHLPMRLSAEALPDAPQIQSFLYGPIVLAADLGAQGLTEDLIRNHQGPDLAKAPLSLPALRPTGRNLEDWIQPDGKSPLSFRAAAGEPVTMKPLNQLWGRYATYWNL